MRKHLLAILMAAMLLMAAASIAEACIPNEPWYQPCGWFGTEECVCSCNSQGVPYGCMKLNAS